MRYSGLFIAAHVQLEKFRLHAACIQVRLSVPVTYRECKQVKKVLTKEGN